MKCNFLKILLFIIQIKDLSVPHIGSSNTVRALLLRRDAEFQIIYV